MFNKPSARRIFLSQNKVDYYKLFSFSQHKDGTIYCHWPNFTNTNWIPSKIVNGNIEIENLDTPANSEKFSLHGSGVLKFKQNDHTTDSGRIKGSHLIDEEKNQVGARHLFTSFISEPKDLCIKSPYGKRPSDVPIYTDTLHSFVIIFFAIPQQTIPVQINFQPSFHTDYFEGIPPKYIGFSHFSLAYHDILWIAYRTKYLGGWPGKNNIIYSDGYFVPIILEQKTDEKTKEELIGIILKEPVYDFNNNTFTLQLSIAP